MDLRAKINGSPLELFEIGSIGAANLTRGCTCDATWRVSYGSGSIRIQNLDAQPQALRTRVVQICTHTVQRGARRRGDAISQVISQRARVCVIRS